jgi:hypothetical protein
MSKSTLICTVLLFAVRAADAGLIFPPGPPAGPLEPIYFEQDVEGTFFNQTYSITLNNLPTHTAVWVGFNLETVGDWQGNSAGDVWKMDDGNPLSPLVTFAFSNVPGLNQSFPTSYPAGNEPAQNLAITATPNSDALYVDAGLYAHTADSLTLNFTGVNNKEWILTNLTVSMFPTPEPSTWILALFGLVALVASRAYRHRS